jgi:hypothetical protein
MYIEHMEFAAYMAVSFITLLYYFAYTFYQFICGCLFCVLLFNCVNYVFLLCLCILIVMFVYSYFYVCYVYSVSLCCSVYCLCVNVYCTAVLFVSECVLYCCTVCV